MVVAFVCPFACDLSLHIALLLYLPTHVQRLCGCVSGDGRVRYYLTLFSFIHAFCENTVHKNAGLKLFGGKNKNVVGTLEPQIGAKNMNAVAHFQNLCSFRKKSVYCVTFVKISYCPLGKWHQKI